MNLEMNLEIEKHSDFASNVDNLYSLFDVSVRRFQNKNCLVQLKNSESVAVRTYEEVSHQVHLLSDSIHLPRHDFIGIVGFEISAEIVVCILGILKSGSAFIFLNATDSETARAAVEKLRIRHLIGEKNRVQEFLNHRWVTSFKLVKMANIFGKEFGVWCRAMEMTAFSTDSEMKFAFAVLSSGSMKHVPKVIKVPHRSILPNILDLKQIYQLEPVDTVLVSTPLTFDPCIHDLFLAFNSGCCVLIADALAICRDEHARKLFDPNEFNVTVCFTTPSVFHKWRLQAGPCSLRILILGGEPFPPMAALHDVFSRGIRIYNIYGITEVSCWASVFRVPRDFQGAVPLGSVLSDTLFEVRDNDGRVIDDGIGELFIGSTCRICAVDDDLELNDEARPYFRSSGDLVKIDAGTYYFVGRKDRRVKLFGHQVDLTLVENRISMHSSVRNCLVFTNDDEIIALIESNATAEKDLTAKTLKKFLSVDLPTHMLPNDIRFVTHLPLGSHGKISSKRGRALYERMILPEDVRCKFGRLWIEYTNQSCLDEECGFLDAGGSSFAAVQLNAALERISNVPQNFIEFLLLNKNFSQCHRLISGKKNDITSSNMFGARGDRTSQSEIDISNVESIEFNRTLTDVLCKGRRLHYGSTLSVSNKIIQVKWRCDLEKCVDSSPTLLVFDDRAVAVCGSHSGYLVVVEIASGVIVLKIKLPHRIESSACPYPDGRLFFIGCHDGNMYAVDIISASIIWKYSTDDIIKSTAVVFDEKLFFGSYDHYFYCISTANGVLMWKVNVDNSAIYATAIVRSDVIISATLAGTVAFIDHNGRVKKSIADLKPIFSDPIEIPDQDIVVVVDVNGSMRCFDLNSYLELWRDEVRSCIFSSLSSMGSDPVKIFFASQNGTVYCFEISRIIHRKLWEHKIGEQVYATPFCCETWNTVIAVTTDGDLHILDADSGDVLTRHSIKAPVFSSPVAFRNNIVVGSRDNCLYCFSVVSKQ